MRDVDKGHAWLCLVGSLGAQLLNGAVTYGSGIFHVALLEHFKEGVAKTALVGSIFANLLCLMGPIASVAINLTSCRSSILLGSFLITVGMVSSYFMTSIDGILITYGIIAGVGFGFTVTTSVVIIGYAFEKYRGPAIGVSVAASGLGLFICGPMHQFFIDQYSVLGAFLLIGGVSCHFFVFGALMKPSGLEEWHKKSIETKGSNTGGSVIKRFFHFEVFKNFSFLFILFSSMLLGLPYSLIMLHLPNYAITLGFTSDEAAFLLALIGIGSTINRILVGLASGTGGLDVLLIYFGTLALTGACTLIFPLISQTYIGQCIYALIFGLYSGAFIALTNPLCLEMVGIEQLPTGVGLYFCFLGIGGLIGPPVAGFIVDSGGTYEYSFYISGGCFLVSAMLALLSTLFHPKVPTNLAANGDVTLSIDSNNLAAFPQMKGSGFLKGSGFFRGSGLMTAPEIFTGSGSFHGSGFFINRHHDSKLKLNGHDLDIVEIIPLQTEEPDTS